MSVIHVCPLSALGKTLDKSGTRHLISLAGPGKTVARPDQITGSYLALEFNDIAEPKDGLIAPNLRDVLALLNFFDNWRQTEPILIHCWMGISRSTAAALIGCARLRRHAGLADIANRIRLVSPMATPNPLMIEIADAEMGFDGELIEAVRAIGRGVTASEGVPFALDVGEF